MDIVLFIVVGIFLVKGFFKGFLAMLFSLVGVVVISSISWGLSESAVEVLKSFSFIQNDLFEIIKNALDGVIGERFSNVDDLLVGVENSNLNVIVVFIIKLLAKDIVFEGNLSVGEVFAPIFHNMLLKTVSFVLMFFVLFVILKVLNVFLNKLIKIAGLSFVNRIFGALLGLIKGMLIFGIIYIIFSAIASFSANETLLYVIQDAEVSSYVYENIFKIFISLFR